MNPFGISILTATILEIIFVPAYLKKCWPKKNKTSLVLKMICASVFVANGALCCVLAGNDSHYALFLILGLAFSWLGDLLLHVSEKLSFFIAGLFAFLGGHIFYTVAYSVALGEGFGSPFFAPLEIIAIFALTAAVLLALNACKTHFGRAAIPVGLYVLTISFMVVKAISLATKIFADGTLSPYAGICLIVGSLFFGFSDFTLALINFGGRKNFPIKIFNIITYFTAQILLGCTGALIIL